MKTYIWSLPTRIFHWLLVIGVIVAYLVSDEDSLLNIHSSIGYMVGILILFRIIWGFFGPKYSRFRDFPIGMKSTKAFITDLKSNKNQSPGHNPAASVIMLAIILFSLLIFVSGILLLASKGQGMFAAVQIGLSSDAFKETHEIAVYILIGLVIAHLLGILIDFIFNRETGTLMSMLTGYKHIEGESIKLSSIQKIVAGIGIIAALAILPYSLITQKITIKAEEHEQKSQFHEEEDDD